MGPLGRIGALGCALLLVLAAIPPVVGGTGGSGTLATAGNEATLAGAGNVPAGSPVALKSEATAAINDADVEKQRYASARDRAYDHINGTLDDYRDPVRLSSMKSFTDDAVGVQALAKLSDSNANVTAVRASRYVALADNQTAYQTILDARRALNQTDGEFDSPGVRRSTQAHLDNAERQFDRAQRRLERASGSEGRRAISQYAQAIRALRTSWQQAQQSLHMLDRRVDPGVAVVNRADPIRNGSESVTRTVAVRLSDPRPWTLDNLTVYVNGQRRLAQPVDRFGNRPIDNRTVGVPVRLSERVANVTVVVTDTDVKPGRNGNGGQSARASATLLLDGDGLNESTETALGTDPLDPDSDSTKTDSDESGTNVVDGREDFDRDGLGTLKEFELGTAPLVADTDDDELRDGIEQLFLPTDPLNSDTDGDGTLDGAEDQDDDTLTTAEELEAGSSLFLADTDRDQLRDPVEVTGETNVTDADTDDDGLLDGVEGTDPFDTDPLNPDTDGDGVLDGNETYTTTTGNESLGATVDITGEGNVAGQTTVDQPTHVRYQDEYRPNASVAPFVDFESRANFTQANITIAYNESRVGSEESNLSIYRFNESAQRYEHVESTVDPKSNTVTATTEHFSTYTVFDNQQWLNYLQHRNDILSLRPNGSTTERIENWTFESMPSSIGASNWTCYVEPRQDGYKDEPADGNCEIEANTDTIRVWEKTNRERFLNRTTTLPEEGPLFVKVRVTAHIQSSWSHAAAVLSIDSGNGETDIYRLESDYDSSSKTKTVVRRVNITEHAGETVTVSLRADARHTNGDNSWLRAHYIDFEQATDGVAKRDSDGDGIPDFREAKGIPLANGPVVTLDPTSADTDGDGIDDGEEVDITSRVTHEPPNSYALETGYRWSSNPAAGSVDTDGDGLTDATERDGWTVDIVERNGQPYRWAPRDGNGTVAVSSDPSNSDSDTDGVTDRAERVRTHTDPSGDVRYGIAGTLAPRGRTDRQDSDQDGFPDELELDGIPTHVDGSFTRIETDLLNPDTDGDELHEAAEFESLTTVSRDVDVATVQSDIFPIISDPTETDSDRDRVVDRAEFELGTDPLSPDTDGDRISDFRDERPLIDDTPPEISLEALRSTGFITVKDDSKVQVDDIEVKPYFEGEGWKPDQSTVIWRPRPGNLDDRPEYPDRYGYDFEGAKPDKYWVNVTDQNGNQASYLVNFQRNDQSTTQVAVTLVVATPAKQGYKSPPTAVITTGAVVVSAALIANSWQLTVSEASGTGATSLLGIESVRTYESTPIGEITLPSGFVKTIGGIRL